MFCVSLLASGGLLPVFGVLGLPSITLIAAFIFTPCSHCVCVCIQISPFYNDASHVGLGAHLTPV